MAYKLPRTEGKHQYYIGVGDYGSYMFKFQLPILVNMYLCTCGCGYVTLVHVNVKVHQDIGRG